VTSVSTYDNLYQHNTVIIITRSETTWPRMIRLPACHHSCLLQVLSLAVARRPTIRSPVRWTRHVVAVSLSRASVAVLHSTRQSPYSTSRSWTLSPWVSAVRCLSPTRQPLVRRRLVHHAARTGRVVTVSLSRTCVAVPHLLDNRRMRQINTVPGIVAVSLSRIRSLSLTDSRRASPFNSLSVFRDVDHAAAAAMLRSTERY